ncbi:hypothetical protein C2845_PM13G14320 [Panicum miliaceum]|uniref:Uncharacterized protein n=1 Tax=Panicum miliaceum TaxID=4540 RepID=A0A3L6RIG6_PANMI|nr:hypothetical protein C2845_PM13G14320 [Panicum miliaceum]
MKKGSCSRLDVNPFKLTWKDAETYFSDEDSSHLLVQVPDPRHELYKLLKENPRVPRMLSEKGKETMWSLISSVTHCHKNNLCLGSSMSIKNLMVSSLGTFQLKKVQTTPLTEQGRVADLAEVCNLLTKILKSRHGPGATRDFP